MKKHLSIAIASILALSAPGIAKAQFYITVDIGGVPTVSGATLENFDEPSPSILTLSGAAYLLTGYGYNATPPYYSGSTAAFFGESPTYGYDNSQYVAVCGGTATLSFSTPQNYLGLLWGSVDTVNTLTFYDSANNIIGTVTGGDILALDPDLVTSGQGVSPNGTAYVNITSTTPFSRVVASNPGAAFEIDDVAYAGGFAYPFNYTDNGDGTATITGYTGSGGDVTIPSTINGLSVTSIGDDVFNGCTNLTSVAIPNSVTSIGDAAFANCTSLTSVTFGNNVTSIGDDAFNGCTSLTSIALPNSVTNIGQFAFYECSALTSVAIPNSVTSIGQFAFSGCYGLTSATIASGAIGDFAFAYCTSLTSVTIGNNVTSIGQFAFYECSALTSVAIPNSVTSIGQFAFSGCYGLTSTTIASGAIGQFAFYGCTSLTEATITSGVIGNYAFGDCTSLTSVTIGNSVTSIGDGAFSGCTSLTSVYFQGNAPSVGSNVFGGDNNATVYYLPGTTGWGSTFGGLPTVTYPLVTTGSASSVTANSATLNGSVNPNGSSTTAYFQWGTSTNYGNNTPSPAYSISNGYSLLNVTVPNLSGLSPSTRYHFRLVASSSAGTAYGADQTFTTQSGGSSSPVSAANSGLIATPSSAVADGSSQITATMTLLDGNGNPLAGKTISFVVTEAATDACGNPVAAVLSVNQSQNTTVAVTTDNYGQAKAIITAGTPGTVTIQAIDTGDFFQTLNPNVLYDGFQTTAQFEQRPLVSLTGDDLYTAIQNLFTTSSGILFGDNSIADIATTEGPIGDYFQGKANGVAADQIIDLVFLGNDVVGQLTAVPAAGTVLDEVKKDLPPAILNYAADLTGQAIFDDIAKSGSGLSAEGTATASVCSQNQQALQNREVCLESDGVPSAVKNSEQTYINDLQLRQQANSVMLQVLQKQEAYLQALENASELEQQNWVGPFLLSVGETGGLVALNALAVIQPEIAPFVFSIDVDVTAGNEYQNQQSFNQYQAAYLSAFSSMQTCVAFTGQVYNNVDLAYSQIALNQPPNPVIGEILGTPQTIEDGYYQTSGADWMTGSQISTDYQVITKAYSLVTIQNDNSSSPANFWVFVFYTYAGTPFGQNEVLEQCGFAQVNNLGAGQNTSFTINHYLEANNGASAVPLSQVQVYVLGINNTGTFYVDSKTITPTLSLQAAPGILPSVKTRGVTPSDVSSNDVVVINNPMKAQVIQNSSNQTYQAQILVLNPFILPLTATVTQPLPDGVAVLTTDGTLQGSSIIWTNLIAPSNAVENGFTFGLAVTPGAQTNLPPPSVVFSDTNGNTLSLRGVAPNFSGLFPVQVNGSIPVGISGVDSIILVAVTNLTGTGQTGSLTVTLTDSSGNAVTNFSQLFSLDGSDGTNLNFTLPGSFPIGSYLLTGSLNINGGTNQVLAGTYVVTAPPITLAPASTAALTANGFNMALQGPAGNYLIEASSDISNPTNWQPVLFYSSTNSPFYFYFTDPNATNFSQQFYRAVTQ